MYIICTYLIKMERFRFEMRHEKQKTSFCCFFNHERDTRRNAIDDGSMKYRNVVMIDDPVSMSSRTSFHHFFDSVELK